MGRFCFVLAMVVAIAVGMAACVSLEPAPLPVAAEQPVLPGAVTCEGPFAKDATHDKLVETFGAANVTFESAFTGYEDIEEMATVLYPNDPARRLKIFWEDRNGRSQPSEILIDDESRWTAGQGLRLGLSLQQVEALNKKPFKIDASETDFFGTVRDWRGGSLNRVRGGCFLGARFLDRKGEYGISEGSVFLSNDPRLRPLTLRLVDIFIHYPKS